MSMALNSSNGNSYGCDFGLGRYASDSVTAGILDKIRLGSDAVLNSASFDR